MKKSLSVICAILVLALTLSLAACGSSGQDYSGTYKLVEMTNNGTDMTQYLSLVGEVILTIDGNRAKLDMQGESSEFTVDSSKMTMSADGSTASFTVEDNKLTMQDESAKTKMVFEKQK